MIFTSKDSLPIKENNEQYCFLAGSIDLNKGNWRMNFIEETKEMFHFFDPTRIEHNSMNDSEMKEHIHWELNALELSNILIPYLPF